MNKKWYFVINPVSGKSGGLKLWERVKSTLDSNEVDYSFVISNYTSSLNASGILSAMF